MHKYNYIDDYVFMCPFFNFSCLCVCVVFVSSVCASTSFKTRASALR